MQEGGVAAVRVEGKFVFDSANHRDFLGACLGTGIERSRVGDILVLGEDGAQIFITPELAQHLVLNLVQVSPASKICSHEREPKPMAMDWKVPQFFVGAADFRLSVNISCPRSSSPILKLCTIKDTVTELYLISFTLRWIHSAAMLSSLFDGLVCEKRDSKQN